MQCLFMPSFLEDPNVSPNISIFKEDFLFNIFYIDAPIFLRPHIRATDSEHPGVGFGWFGLLWSIGIKNFTSGITILCFG